MTNPIKTELVETKTIAIYSGGDWADASCEHLKIDKEANLELLDDEYQNWYNSEYIPKYRANEKPKYYSFAEWLVEFKNATTSHDVEEFFK